MMNTQNSIYIKILVLSTLLAHLDDLWLEKTDHLQNELIGVEKEHLLIYLINFLKNSTDFVVDLTVLAFFLQLLQIFFWKVVIKEELWSFHFFHNCIYEILMQWKLWGLFDVLGFEDGVRDDVEQLILDHDHSMEHIFLYAKQ